MATDHESSTEDPERSVASPTIAACLLTTGDRAEELAAAVASAQAAGVARCVVLANGCELGATPDGAKVLTSDVNLGVPGGRRRLAEEVDADLLLYLDDDARIVGDWVGGVVARFVSDEALAVVSLRLVDEDGATARRHTPRVGTKGVDASGDVATFLGGASVIRRSALLEVGDYWSELFYGHEELELAWRLYDRGYSVFYDADTEVFHPKTEIVRHADGWRLTGRNRVMIARRDLPWPVAAVHVTFWLVVGVFRAPGWSARRAYLAGWWGGWSVPVDRRPIRWSTVRRLGEVGRLPVI